MQSHFFSCSFQDGANAFFDLSTDAFSKERGALDSDTSLRNTYLCPGDVYYIPYGSVICDKIMGSHSIGLRVPVLFVSELNRFSALLLELGEPHHQSTVKPIAMFFMFF